MSDPALIVPLRLDVMVANAAMVETNGFRSWAMNYTALTRKGGYNSPEPAPFDADLGTTEPGVYLHWVLPEALRHGVQQGAGGPATYPLVPNRWLVVRLSGDGADRAATSWVVESDGPSLDADVDRSMYLADPELVRLWRASSDGTRRDAGAALDASGGDEPQVVSIGRRTSLERWSEPDADTMFVTAMGPANPVFSVFVPHNRGVFSFYDSLTGIDEGSLSYAVIGWYSDPGKDVLASWAAEHGDTDAKRYAALLSELEWAPTPGATTLPRRSLYEGTAFDVTWKRSGDPPAPDPLEAIRKNPSLGAALGNTTIDAFTALITRQLKAAGQDDRAPKLLRALQYDLLRLLDEPNGEALLDRAIRDASHGPHPGGLRWTLEDVDPSKATRLRTAATTVLADPNAWVAELNAAQTALDDALGRLTSLQWQLNAMWLKAQKLKAPGPPPDGPSEDEVEAQLDPATTDGLAARTIAAGKVVQSLLDSVPQPVRRAGLDAQAALNEGIDAFADRAGLPPTLALRAVPAPRYWKPNDPVLVLSGVDPPAESIPDDALAVRASEQIVTSLAVAGGTPIDAKAATSALSLAGVSKLPDAIAALAAEVALLDPGSAAALAHATNQPAGPVATAIAAHDPASYPGAALPALGLRAWSQPWEPMFVEWEVAWQQIPDPKDWTFDGDDYRFQGAARPAAPHPIGGISLLGPHAQLVFRDRLQTFVKQFGATVSPGELDGAIEAIDRWQFLSQELAGFGELLALRDGRTFRRPGPDDRVGDVSLLALLGYADAAHEGPEALPADARGQVTTAPYLPDAGSPFNLVRQGQGYLTRLSLYDKFGRVLQVADKDRHSGINLDSTFDPARDEALRPAAFAVDATKDYPGIFELPPRLLEFARLDFALVDATDRRTRLTDDRRADPVGGWVLADHLDASLVLFAPDGRGLGQYRLVAGEDGTRSGTWEPPAHGTVSRDDVRRIAPEIGRLIDSKGLEQAKGFEALFGAIDATLWTTDGLGVRADENLSVLIGRPLALVSAQIGLATRGPVPRDPSWKTTIDPPDPPELAQPFVVRLGDLATRDDGLMGYFVGDDRERFNSVAAAAGGQDYVHQIGPPGTASATNYLQLRLDDPQPTHVTMLVDPRAGIHATSGILPVKRLDLPAAAVNGGLRGLEVGFAVGPLLTYVEPTPVAADTTPAHPLAVVVQRPAERRGTWSWWDRAGDTGYELVDATPDAMLKGFELTLRDGVLELDLDDVDQH